MRLSVCLAGLAFAGTAAAQPKSSTATCTDELVAKGNTFEVASSTRSANSEVTYADAGDSEIKLALQNAILTVTDSGRVLCSNPIATFQFAFRMTRAWLKDPANAGSLALALRCAAMFDRADAATPLALVVSSTEKLTALDPTVTATAFGARAKLDQPALRFFNCRR